MEFALIVTPFLGMLFAIIQVALVFWSQQALETAVAEASRQLYIGAFQGSTAGQNSSTQRANFKEAVCQSIPALFDCRALVNVDVRVLPSFTAPPPGAPVTNGNYDPSDYRYEQPARNDIVLVRASMEYPTYVRILNPSTGLKSGNTLIMATAAFRAEPF